VSDVASFDRYAKSIVGAITAGVGAVGVALADDSVTATEWVVVALSVLTSLAMVWGVPNTRPIEGELALVEPPSRPGQHERIYFDPDDRDGDQRPLMGR
jgi:hypothetical protein